MELRDNNVCIYNKKFSFIKCLRYIFLSVQIINLIFKLKIKLIDFFFANSTNVRAIDDGSPHRNEAAMQ